MRSQFEFASAFARADVPLLLLALSFAVTALYAGNILSQLFDAIAREETGLRGSSLEEHRFVERVRRPEYVLLLVTAAGASQGVPWSATFPLCLAGLSIARLPKYVGLWPRATEIGAQGQVYMAITLSSIVSIMSAVSMFATGALAGWLLQ